MQKGRDTTRVNKKILYRTEEVRVISSDGEQLGILKTTDALERARELALDLVEVSPAAKPPVCRIMDYGKFKYEESKKTKAAKAKQHVVKTKEIKLHPKTDNNDYSYRLERAKEFLEKGFKVKVTVVFRGRELAHMDYGSRWLVKMQEDLTGIAAPEEKAKREGRNMSAVFSPAKQVTKPQKQIKSEENRPISIEH